MDGREIRKRGVRRASGHESVRLSVRTHSMYL